MQRYDEALADLTRSLELDSESDWGVYQRGLVLFALGDVSGFRRDIDRAIRLSEDIKNEWSNPFNLAVYYLAIGNIIKGHEIIEHAAKSDRTKYHFTECLSDLRDLDVAIPILGLRDMIKIIEANSF
jgi:tetratricopeptide (TPR) repeat protein